MDCKTQEEVDEFWRRLSEGGEEGQFREACCVGFLFNVYDRLADSLGFRLHPEAEYRGMARNLLGRGYV